jgi:hypothetical protein
MQSAPVTTNVVIKFVIDLRQVGGFINNTCMVWIGLWCLNATFNNISVISSLSVLLVQETRGFGENHRPVPSHRQTLLHNVVHQGTRINGQNNDLHKKLKHQQCKPLNNAGELGYGKPFLLH